MGEPIQTWKFEPRPCVSPKESAAEWAWVVDWVKGQGLAGKAYAVRDIEIDGEYAIASFTVWPGQTTKTDRETRNL